MFDEDEYYKHVEEYYDFDSITYQSRLETNKILLSMREDFRKITSRYLANVKNVLEIGCGTGVDIEFFSKNYSNISFIGIDISQNMVNLSSEKIKGLGNARILKSRVEELPSLGLKFDLVYSFFGALNTVKDLKKCARSIIDITSDNGIVVISVINKFYLQYIFYNLLRFRFKKAFSRISNNFYGYSPHRSLRSFPYSFREIKEAFSELKLVFKKGYSIFAPPWFAYSDKIYKLYKVLSHLDNIINHTFLWRFGEYSLYVFKK